MSQNMKERRKAAKVWSQVFLEDFEPHLSDPLGETIKDLAEESVKRLDPRKCGNNWEWHQAIAWRDYFIAAFDRVLRELPPRDCSVEELRQKVAELQRVEVAVEAVMPQVNVNPAANPVANKKRPATDQDGDDNANANANAPNMSKRAKKDSEATGNNFTVYTKGRYTVRVTEGDTPNTEFTFNVPATVQVKMVPGSGAAADVEAEGSDD